MKGKRLAIVVSIALVTLLVSLAVFPGCKPAPKEVYEWKIQSGYPRGDISMGLLNDFAAAAEARSDGQLKITVFAEPEIVPLEQLFEATKKGTLDMLQAGGTFWGGIVPVGEIEFGIPFVYSVPEEKTFEDQAEAIRKFYYESGFVDLLREEYAKQGLYWLDMHTYGPCTLFSKVPVKTMDDLKGKKIRDEGLWTVFHDRLGARGTYISGTEAYMALKLGTLDMSQWDVSGITGLSWQEVAPYWILPNQDDQIIGHILVNMDAWNSLPDNLKKALAGAAEDYWNATVKTYAEEVKKAEQTPGVQMCWMNDDTIAKWEEVAYGLWDEMAAKDAACAKAIELIKEWRGVK
jgi:TRAP-type mannitol/chloroaromatic compound transport system substrate-binding protein